MTTQLRAFYSSFAEKFGSKLSKTELTIKMQKSISKETFNNVRTRLMKKVMRIFIFMTERHVYRKHEYLQMESQSRSHFVYIFHISRNS